MGIDYTTTLGYGVPVGVPQGIDDPEGWLEELVRPFDLRYMTAGSHWSGDIEHYVVTKAYSVDGRCGGASKIDVDPDSDSLAAFVRAHNGGVILDPVPGWWLGLLIS